MNGKIRKRLARCKRSIAARLERKPQVDPPTPVFAGGNIHYEMADRQRGIVYGGVGLFHELAKQTGLIEAIDRRVHLLKVHAPYHESDHVLNFAFNALCDGRVLQDIELRRNDEAFLDALGADRIPDPTTAGDFCRRFDEYELRMLDQAIDETRLKVWARQPAEFFDRATLDFDGTLVPTRGEKKEGVDISYDGTWGYHPLVCTMAQTGEVLRIINRSGNRPSHEGAWFEADQLIDLCRTAGFREILLRGDTDFSQSQHLERWDNAGVKFVFGFDANARLKAKAELLPKSAWKRLSRPPQYEVQTKPRQKRDQVKQRIVEERMYKDLRLESEDYAEFDYRPAACKKAFRMVVVRKNLKVSVAQQRLFPETRYFFYIANLTDAAPNVVFTANKRCNQENLIEQLHNGCQALRAGLDTLVANNACMVMTALAWNLKAWAGLWLPESPGRWQERHQEQKRNLLKIEFRTFINTFMRLPCQIIRTGRRLIYRLLGWNPTLEVFFRLAHVLRC